MKNVRTVWLILMTCSYVAIAQDDRSRLQPMLQDALRSQDRFSELLTAFDREIGPSQLDTPTKKEIEEQIAFKTR